MPITENIHRIMYNTLEQVLPKQTHTYILHYFLNRLNSHKVPFYYVKYLDNKPDQD